MRIWIITMYIWVTEKQRMNDFTNLRTQANSVFNFV